MNSSSPTSQADAQINQADGLAYWNSIPATVSGMLGGIPSISRTDLRGSLTFLEKLRRLHPPPSSDPFVRGIDCGAGIGRVTAGVLSKICVLVDIVELVEKFAQEARSTKMLGEGKVGQVYVTGLQDWVPTEKYDLMWNQWCLGHLTDGELVQYLARCKEAVARGGWIVVKENMSTDPEGKDMFDEVDSSVTRTDENYRRLFADSGLQIVKTEMQNGFPSKLLPVRFYALQST